ncbi:MAG TPA: 2'-5' RNA ligase family protein [Candidatus Saccharimonadales bacterium]|nr:2'-5' RNA ligase family protein [Candidatus Saccharimonadales bacterium]
MARRNEHLVVAMLEPIEIGKEFIDWPLHITLAPWFPCDDENKLDKILSEIAGRHSGFGVEVGGIEDFGGKNPVPVNVIVENDNLSKLHRDIINGLEASGFSIHQKEYIGEGYRPHVTHQKHARKSQGEQIKIESFGLAKQIRLKKIGTMVKTLVKNYELG